MAQYNGRKKLCFAFFVCSFLLTLFYYENIVLRTQKLTDFFYETERYPGQYLISTAGCSIPFMNPFSADVLKYLAKPRKIFCSGDILTYISKEGETVYLNINKSLITEEKDDFTCFVEEVQRDMSAKIPDDSVVYNNHRLFKNRIELANESIVRVFCENKYENFHYIFRNEKQLNYLSRTKPNVLLIGFDAMARSNFIRTMPRTFQFFKENHWIDLKGYNKILHNTFPNLMAVLAGVQINDSLSYNQHFMDNYFDSFIWKKFSSLNYTTAYSEDFPRYATFNYGKMGFKEEPTNYYLRPYYWALRNLPTQDYCDLENCFGPENIGLRMIQFVKDYVATVKNNSNYLGFFWMNSFSHSDLNCPGLMDEPVTELFEYLKNENIFEDTFIVFFSDHGFRFGDISETRTGWLENRLPFNFIYVPEMFKDKYMQKYFNLGDNQEKLTSPYDLFMTFQDILKIFDESYNVTAASGCEKCHSLFEVVSDSRTCEDAGIPEYWCTCSKYVTALKSNPLSQDATQYAVKLINNLLTNTNCSKYSLQDILEVKFYKISESSVKNVMVRISMDPPAKFEVNLNVFYHNETNVDFSMQDIERLDHYAEVSWCTNDKNLRSYCYCLPETT